MKHKWKMVGGWAEASEYRCIHCNKRTQGWDEWIHPKDLQEECNKP